MVREHQAKLIESFNDWFERRQADESLWPAFDRWVRDALSQHMGARRVRCFHATEEGRRLVSLTTQLAEPLWPPGGLPGLIVHALANGQTYVRAGHTNGASVERLADEWAALIAETPGLKSPVPQWLAPIRLQGRAAGLVLVGELPEAALADEAELTATSALLTVFWRHVAQAQALALAERTDQSSGVLTWADLATGGERVLAESSGEGEPVVVLALALEGIRRLDDHGHWRLRDGLMRQTGAQMRAKLRSDDLVGRFSEDRFVAVLRRLDLALGEIIARKLLATVEGILDEQPVLAEMVTARCGVSDANDGGFQAALSRAFDALRVARLENRNGPVVITRGQHERTPVAQET